MIIPLVLALLSLGGSAPPASTTHLQAAELPTLPLAAGEGGEVRLEATVDRDGAVSDVKVLRDTPPFTPVLAEAVSKWRFEPGPGAPHHALVIGLFRPPDLADDLTAPGRDLTTGSADLPWPQSSVVPPYPVTATDDGVVVLEVSVSRTGGNEGVEVVSGGPPFADLARRSIARWSFRPARTDGQPIPARAWVVVGFRAPITR
jgi:TonB family protein